MAVKNKTSNKKSDILWIAVVTVVSFVTSAVLSVVSSELLKRVDILVAFLLILLIIAVNIVSDTVGTAVTAADETPFHAMASRKVFGAKRAIYLVRNAHRVSNICNDVVGDICGVISGAAGAYIVVRLAGDHLGISIADLLITGCIAAFTVGGKALGKIIAIRNSNFIIFRAGVIIQFIAGGNGSITNNSTGRKSKTNEKSKTNRK